MPLVSIIITNYNGKKYLIECIELLKSNFFSDFEIIIVDNSSSDGSVSLLKENYPQIKVLELDKNFGLSIASNFGRKFATGKYLFFYNNDTIADKEMLSELVKTAESDKNIGICGCKTLTYDGTRKINCGVPLDIFGYPYGGEKCFYVDAAIFIRSDLFDMMGGFDPAMFLYCEDRDLCWRCWLYGYKVVAVDSAIFKHDSFCTINANGKLITNIKKRFMGEAYTLRMLLKNYSLPVLFKVLPRYLIINMVEMILFIMRGKLSIPFMVYLRAYLWNIINLKDTLNLRKIIQRNRIKNDNFIQNRMFKGNGKWKLFKQIGIPRFES